MSKKMGQKLDQLLILEGKWRGERSSKPGRRQYSFHYMYYRQTCRIPNTSMITPDLEMGGRGGKGKVNRISSIFVSFLRHKTYFLSRVGYLDFFLTCFYLRIK